MDHFPDLKEVLNRFLGRDPIVIGDLNADAGLMKKPWNQKVADFLYYFGLVDLLGNFRKRLRFLHNNTWWQVHQGKFLCLRCDYILVSYRQVFKTVGIRYA